MPAVGGKLISLVKSAQIEKPPGKGVSVLAEKVFIDALQFLNIFILVEPLGLCTHNGGVIGPRMIYVIEVKPVQALHICVVRRENALYPADGLLKILP